MKTTEEIAADCGIGSEIRYLELLLAGDAPTEGRHSQAVLESIAVKLYRRIEALEKGELALRLAGRISDLEKAETFNRARIQEVEEENVRLRQKIENRRQQVKDLHLQVSGLVSEKNALESRIFELRAELECDLRAETPQDCSPCDPPTTARTLSVDARIQELENDKATLIAEKTALESRMFDLKAELDNDLNSVCNECGHTIPPTSPTLLGSFHATSCSLYVPDGPTTAEAVEKLTT